MNNNLFDHPGCEGFDVFSKMLLESDLLYVKKLSLNDRDWARLPNKHQAGVYIPPGERDGGFFPPLSAKARDRNDAAEIREVHFEIDWPTVGVSKRARLVHYKSKGQETHLTGLPKHPFRQASPASLLLMAQKEKKYRAVVLDSVGNEYEVACSALSLPLDFRSGIFAANAIRRTQAERVSLFVDEVVTAFWAGKLSDFAMRYAKMPSTAELASTARQQYLKQSGLKSLNPYAMARPGDALREISRRIEYDIFKECQIKARSIDLVRVIFGDNPSQASLAKALRSTVLDFPKIDALLLSAAQQRKSRAGYSFEHHIEAMLSAGFIPFEKQVIIDANKRPDFILPNKTLYDDPLRCHKEALVLSAKTTLRERWKQVKGEMKRCDLYLATVDESIAGNAIIDMASQGIQLVVPESLKGSEFTEYKSHTSVISFKEFFENDIVTKKPLWLARGLFAVGK